MMKLLKNIYTKLQNTKQHLWSHYIMLTGWLLLLYLTVYCFIEKPLDIFFFKINTIAILNLIIAFLIIIFIIEEGCYKNFRLKSFFLTKQPVYNIIWSFGIILFIVITILSGIFIIFYN